MAQRVGLFSCDSVGKPYVQMVEFCKEKGYAGLELFDNNDLQMPDTEVAKKVRDKALELDVTVCCMSQAANLMAQDQKAQVQRTKGYIQVAELAGAPYIHFTVFPRLCHDVLGVNRRKMLQTVAPAIRELCDYAGQRGICCLVEGQGFYVNGVEVLTDLLGEVDHPNLGIVADFGNVLCVEEEPERFVSAFAPLVRHVHVKDMAFSQNHPNDGRRWIPTKGGSWLNRCDLGAGIVNIEKCLRILKNAGYTGNYVIENTVFDRIDKAAEDLRYLQDLLGRVYKEEEK